MKRENALMKVWDYPINGSQVYFIAFLFYFLPTLLGETTFSTTISGHLLMRIACLSIPLLIFKIYVLDKWSPKELIVISLLLILGVIVWRKAHNVDLLMLFPFIIGAKNVDFRSIIQWHFYLTLLFLLLVMVFALIKIIPNLIYYSESRPTRYSLGMLYPSVIAAHYLYLTLDYCYLRFGKLNILDYLVILLGDYICMLLTNTRLDFLATLLAIPVMIVAQRAFAGKRWSQIIASFWWMATPILSALTIFLSYFYISSNHILHKINALSSGRLALGNQAFERYNVNLLGRTIVEYSYAGVKGRQLASGIGFVQHSYFYIDSSYVRMLLLWGLLTFLIVVGVLTFIAIRSTKQKTFVLSSIILLASLSFMFEPHIVQIIYNPFLLSLLANSYYTHFKREKENAR